MMEKITTVTDFLSTDFLSGGFINGIIVIAIAVGIVYCLTIILNVEKTGKIIFHFTRALFYGFCVYVLYKVDAKLNPDKISIITFAITVIVSFGFVESIVKIIKIIFTIIRETKKMD